jgi:steroid delta-isomerase-like uncharacterized protein
MTDLSGATDPLTIVEQFIDALNQGDRERFSSYLHPEAVWHSAATGEIENGRDDVARNLFGFRGGFPDLHEEITNAFASDDQAVLETVVTGTYDAAAIPNLPGSGRHVSLPLCYLLRVSDGKIIGITTYMDYRTLMVQLDMIMTPTGSP